MTNVNHLLDPYKHHTSVSVTSDPAYGPLLKKIPPILLPFRPCALFVELPFHVLSLSSIYLPMYIATRSFDIYFHKVLNSCRRPLAGRTTLPEATIRASPWSGALPRGLSPQVWWLLLRPGRSLLLPLGRSLPRLPVFGTPPPPPP